MVLSNFFKWMYSAVLYPRYGGWSEDNTGIKNINGESITIGRAGYVNEATRTQSLNDMSIYIGSGNTPPTTTDYKLEAAITSIAGGEISQARTCDNGNAKAIFIYTGTYTGEQEVTITEIGICKNMYYSTGINTTPVLFTRSLLDSPLTLNNGDRFSVQTELVIGAES